MPSPLAPPVHGQRPQKISSASSISKPADPAGARQGAAPSEQSRSTVRPHPRPRRWWWLSPIRVSNSSGLPAGSIRRTSPAPWSARTMSYTAWAQGAPIRSRAPCFTCSTVTGSGSSPRVPSTASRAAVRRRPCQRSVSVWLGPVLRVWAVLVWRALVPLVLAYDIAANATANLNHPTIRTIVPFTAVPFTAVPFTAVLFTAVPFTAVPFIAPRSTRVRGRRLRPRRARQVCCRSSGTWTPVREDRRSNIPGTTWSGSARRTR